MNKRLFVLPLAAFAISALSACAPTVAPSSSEEVTSVDPNEGKTKVTVDYNYEGDTDLVVYLSEGEYFDQPEDPTREGYIFDDWFDGADTDLADYVTFPIQVGTEEVTIYAGWFKAFTVTFHLNVPQGVTGTFEDVYNTTLVKENSPVSLPENPVLKGVFFGFKEWTTDVAGAETFDLNTLVTADLDLYAQWEEVEFPQDEIDAYYSYFAEKYGTAIPEFVSGHYDVKEYLDGLVITADKQDDLSAVDASFVSAGWTAVTGSDHKFVDVSGCVEATFGNGSSGFQMIIGFTFNEAGTNAGFYQGTLQDYSNLPTELFAPGAKEGDDPVFTLSSTVQYLTSFTSSNGDSMQGAIIHYVPANTEATEAQNETAFCNAFKAAGYTIGTFTGSTTHYVLDPIGLWYGQVMLDSESLNGGDHGIDLWAFSNFAQDADAFNIKQKFTADEVKAAVKTNIADVTNAVAVDLTTLEATDFVNGNDGYSTVAASKNNYYELAVGGLTPAGAAKVFNSVKTQVAGFTGEYKPLAVEDDYLAYYIVEEGLVVAEFEASLAVLEGHSFVLVDYTPLEGTTSFPSTALATFIDKYKDAGSTVTVPAFTTAEFFNYEENGSEFTIAAYYPTEIGAYETALTTAGWETIAKLTTTTMSTYKLSGLEVEVYKGYVALYGVLEITVRQSTEFNASNFAREAGKIKEKTGYDFTSVALTGAYDNVFGSVTYDEEECLFVGTLTLTSSVAAPTGDNPELTAAQAAILDTDAGLLDEALTNNYFTYMEALGEYVAYGDAFGALYDYADLYIGEDDNDMLVVELTVESIALDYYDFNQDGYVDLEYYEADDMYFGYTMSAVNVAMNSNVQSFEAQVWGYNATAVTTLAVPTIESALTEQNAAGYSYTGAYFDYTDYKKGLVSVVYQIQFDTYSEASAAAANNLLGAYLALFGTEAWAEKLCLAYGVTGYFNASTNEFVMLNTKYLATNGVLIVQDVVIHSANVSAYITDVPAE